MTEPTPTDAEINALAEAYLLRMFGSRVVFNGTMIDFARAVLAKWGTPPVVAGEPVGVVGYTVHGTQYVNWLSKAPAHGTPIYTASQPTQAQAGAVESAEFDQFLSDVLTAAGLVTHGKQCKALGERLADMCMKLRIHGIKGGQHGAE